jgi:hypothetical protein
MGKIAGFTNQLVSNFYVGTTTIFLVWITFFDGNDLITLFSNKLQLMDAEREIQFYQTKIDEVYSENQKLQDNNDAKERIAREKFLMKKADEDVFVIPQEKENSILDRLIGF